jgi:hypothetical protein
MFTLQALITNMKSGDRQCSEEMVKTNLRIKELLNDDSKKGSAAGREGSSCGAL